MKLPSAVLVIAFAIPGFVACRDQRSAKQSAGPAAAVETTTYRARGVVKSIDAKRPSIEIDHEDIPDLMPAMTMEFYVKDISLLEGIKTGDTIEFTVENGVTGLSIAEIKKPW